MAKEAWNTDRIEDLTGRVVVITGATSGIGAEAARVLANKNAIVIIGARNLVKADSVIQKIKAEKPTADIVASHLDLTDLAAVNQFANSIIQIHQRLDVLINNAGIMACPYSQTKDGFEGQII